MAIDLVFFDCDSTLTSVEGVDELARRAGVLDQVAALTTAAMEGRVPLEQVYGRRLDLIRPDREALDWLGERYVATLVPDAGKTVAALRGAGCEVRIVSGGLRPAVIVLAAHLGVADDLVHAVDIRFDDSGAYAGFDIDSPLAGAGGKAALIRPLVATARGAVMVGDGVTDLEAADAGARVIGFGGVVVRRAVKEAADRWVVGPSLWPVVVAVADLE